MKLPKHYLQTTPSDILQLIINYIPPINLPKTFTTHHLNFDIPFTYDASHHDLSINTFNVIFELFPSITLTGASIQLCNNENITSIHPNINIHNIKILKIQTHSQHPNELYINHLQNYPNISKLFISNFVIKYDQLSILNNNTTYIEINNCYFISNYLFLRNYPNIKTIKFAGTITNELLIGLSSCKLLKSLTFDTIHIITNLNLNNNNITRKLRSIQVLCNVYDSRTCFFIKTLIENHTNQNIPTTITIKHSQISYLQFANYIFKYPFHLKIIYDEYFSTTTSIPLIPLVQHLTITFKKFNPNTTILLPQFPILKTIELINCNPDTSMFNDSIKITQKYI